MPRSTNANANVNANANANINYTLLIVAVFCFALISVVLLRYAFAIGDKEIVDRCPVGKVCLEPSELNKLKQETKIGPPTSETSYTRQRDMRVLNDPLYPALNRTERGQFEGVARQTAERNINIPTQGLYNDSYRLVGYLSNEEDKLGSYKLFGRQKDRNTGEYYMVPVNAMYDLKIQITDDIVKGEKLRSVDTLPNEINFESPLLAKTPYVLTELPKGNLGDEYF